MSNGRKTQQNARNAQCTIISSSAINTEKQWKQAHIESFYINKLLSGLEEHHTFWFSSSSSCKHDRFFYMCVGVDRSTGTCSAVYWVYRNRMYVDFGTFFEFLPY